jgi:hypothetical protein
VNGTDGERERGVELLLRAMELREEQLRKQSGSREWLSQARESYARGLLAVKRAEEALELLELALRVHQEEFGHGTWRTRTILMAKFWRWSSCGVSMNGVCGGDLAARSMRELAALRGMPGGGPYEAPELRAAKCFTKAEPGGRHDCRRVARFDSPLEPWNE